MVSKKRRLKLSFISGLLFALIIAVMGFFTLQQIQEQSSQEFLVKDQSVPSDSFSYQGRENTDALTLLQEKAEVRQDASGLVTSINGRAADGEKREYWAFSVNGTLSQVGPREYQTKATDTIEWRIATY